MDLRRGADKHERELRGWRHIHLRAHRADFRDKLDDEADLGFRRRIFAALESRPFGQRQQTRAGQLGRGRDRPKLLGHEGHEGMQELDDLIEDKGRGGAGLVLGRTVRALQERLGEFEIPVTKNIPDETIGGVGGIVETIGF